jgi:hypothetical protein
VRLGVFYFPDTARVKEEADISSRKHVLQEEPVGEQPAKKQCVQFDEDDHTDSHPIDFDDVTDVAGV